MFAKMSNTELRAYITGCHASREYDAYFESACRELHERETYAMLRSEFGKSGERIEGLDPLSHRPLGRA